MLWWLSPGVGQALASSRDLVLETTSSEGFIVTPMQNLTEPVAFELTLNHR